MDNFDLKKYLAEGKLNENTDAISPEEVRDMAQMVADAFTAEDAEGDRFSTYMVYKVGNVDGMSFELDTEATEQTPEDDAKYGTGEGWGGMFRVKPTDNGYEIRNSEKGGLVATMDGSGFTMLDAEQSKAEMGGDTDYMERRKETDDYMEEGKEIEEAGGDAQLMPSDPIVGFSQVASEFRDKLENNPQIDKIADMIIAKMSAEDKEAFVQKFKGKDEKSIFKMAMAMLKGLDEAVIDRDSAAGKFVALLGNLAGLNLMALGGGVLGVFIGKVLLGIAVPVIPALISLVVSLIIRNVAGKLLGSNPDYTGLAGLEENKEIKSNKMKKSELKEMIKAAMSENARTDAEEEGYLDGMRDEKEDMKEAEDVEVEDNEDIDVDIEKDVDVKVDDEESEVDVDIKASMPGESEDVEEVQALLMKAQEAAESLGDTKLQDQIGNTITYFTRAHVAGNVSEMDDMDVNVNTTEMEAEMGLEEAKDEEVKENLNESVVFPMWNKIK